MYSILLNAAFAAYFMGMVFYFLDVFFSHKALQFLARALVFCAAACLTAYTAIRWYIAARPPFSNMFESLILFALGVGAALIFVDLKYKVKSISSLVALMGLLALGYASFLDKEITPLVPALKSNWLATHVLTCFIGYSALTVGFVSGLVILFKKGEVVKLDTVSYKVIAFGFLFLAIGIITGAVWANSAWGTYWSWDPKETWSLITWFIYAIYLHTRLVKGWKGRKAAALAVIGFLAMLFTYFGVNYLLSGLHSYA